ASVRVFSDDFETTPSSAWSRSAIDSSSQPTFTKFSGRFSNADQVLSLTGLTPGETYIVNFDLYAFDRWTSYDVLAAPFDPTRLSTQPERFHVLADGQPAFGTSISHTRTVPQALGVTGTVQLQVVPVISSLDFDAAQSPVTVTTIHGSGFADGDLS